MRLRSLVLREFRNLPAVRLDLAGNRHFFVGPNAQGKTNLLEAVGLLTALRSFRTADHRLMIREGKDAARVEFEIDHEKFGGTRVSLRLGRDGKELVWDENRVTRLADFLGRFPTAVFSSQDVQLIRGAPAVRRRWLDLTLAAMEPAYLHALQDYGRALGGRNSLLRQDRTTAAELEAFEHRMAPAAAALVALRASGLESLGRRLADAYRALTAGEEVASLGYRPASPVTEEAEFRARLKTERPRDRQLRTTQSGPHRDDVELLVANRPAREFGSEGQQRSLVLALRLAQASWFHERSGVRPILLADDILGELDAARRDRFWSAIDPEAQVLATGTELPAAALGPWQVFRVRNGDVGPEG